MSYVYCLVLKSGEVNLARHTFFLIFLRLKVKKNRVNNILGFVFTWFRQPRVEPKTHLARATVEICV